MDDLISKQAAIDLYKKYKPYLAVRVWEFGEALKQLPYAQPDNKVNLCDSCKYSYPDCPSGNDVIFGNGTGNDNICACSKYEPSAQPERKMGKWIRHKNKDGEYYGHDCSVCGEWYVMPYGKTKFCPNCGAKMGAQDD